jgi:hypothetical protein
MLIVEEKGDRSTLNIIQQNLINLGFDTVQCEYGAGKIIMTFGDKQQYHLYKVAIENSN